MNPLVPSNLLERLRACEIDDARRWFPPGATVLDVGGGNGFQARLLGGHGYRVSVIDLEDGEFPWHTSYFPVTYYDGRHIPFGDQSFDVVFSSNVLEHVPAKTLPILLAEMRRVLKPGGVMVHLMPTPSWRLWSTATHYVFLLRRVMLRVKRLFRGAATTQATAPSNTPASISNCTTGPGSRMARLAKMLWPHAHGEYPSAAHELYYFSRRRWLHLLHSNGLHVELTYPGGMFYTGAATFPWLPLGIRRVLANVLGSACCVFVVRSQPAAASSKRPPTDKAAA